MGDVIKEDYRCKVSFMEGGRSGGFSCMLVLRYFSCQSRIAPMHELDIHT